MCQNSSAHFVLACSYTNECGQLYCTLVSGCQLIALRSFFWKKYLFDALPPPIYFPPKSI